MAKKRKNAGTGSKRYAKKRYKKVATWARGRASKADLETFRSSFQRHTKKSARRKSNSKRKRSANPKALLFSTKSAALKYARSHGIPKSRYSLKRMKKAR